MCCGCQDQNGVQNGHIVDIRCLIVSRLDFCYVETHMHVLQIILKFTDLFKCILIVLTFCRTYTIHAVVHLLFIPWSNITFSKQASNESLDFCNRS